MSLPQPLGWISDYGAQLGRSTRSFLEERIGDLAESTGVQTYLLITLLDPWSDPSLLAERIWEAWELRPERSILLLFVREGERWAFRLRASPDLRPRLQSPEAQSVWESVTRLVADREIASAAREAVTAVIRLLQPSPSPADPDRPASAPNTAPERTSSWKLYAALAGAVGGLGLLGGAIAYALLWLCPGCGGRLRRSPLGGYAYGYGAVPRRAGRTPRVVRRGWVYYCRRCGYRRMTSGRERGRGPRRPVRPLRG